MKSTQATSSNSLVKTTPTSYKRNTPKPTPKTALTFTTKKSNPIANNVTVSVEGLPSSFYYLVIVLVVTSATIIGLFLVYQLLTIKVLVTVTLILLGVPLINLAGRIYSARTAAEVQLQGQELDYAAKKEHIQGQVTIRELEQTENLLKLSGVLEIEKNRLSNESSHIQEKAHIQLEQLKYDNKRLLNS